MNEKTREKCKEIFNEKENFNRPVDWLFYAVSEVLKVLLEQPESTLTGADIRKILDVKEKHSDGVLCSGCGMDVCECEQNNIIEYDTPDGSIASMESLEHPTKDDTEPDILECKGCETEYGSMDKCCPVCGCVEYTNQSEMLRNVVNEIPDTTEDFIYVDNCDGVCNCPQEPDIAEALKEAREQRECYELELKGKIFNDKYEDTLNASIKMSDNYEQVMSYEQQERASLEHLFKLQRKAMDKARKYWQEQTGQETTFPDLTKMLKWFFDQIAHEQQRANTHLNEALSLQDEVVHQRNKVDKLKQAVRDFHLWFSCYVPTLINGGDFVTYKKTVLSKITELLK